MNFKVEKVNDVATSQASLNKILAETINDGSVVNDVVEAVKKLFSIQVMFFGKVKNRNLEQNLKKDNLLNLKDREALRKMVTVLVL